MELHPRNKIILAFAGLLIVLSSAEVCGRSAFVERIPNGDVLRCATCHPGGNTGQLNQFGRDFETAGLVWSSALKVQDADGDGFPNHVELQDYFQTWSPSDASPGDAALVSNPGNPASIPPPPSDEPAEVFAGLTLQHWEPLAPAFTSPLFLAEDGLGFRVPASEETKFGIWQTRESLTALPAGIYRLTAMFEVEPALEGLLQPELRLRAFSADNSFSALAVTANAGGQPVRSIMNVYFESDGSTPWRVALDVIAADGNYIGGAKMVSLIIAPE